jgi:hypothetical protein
MCRPRKFAELSVGGQDGGAMIVSARYICCDAPLRVLSSNVIETTNAKVDQLVAGCSRQRGAVRLIYLEYMRPVIQALQISLFSLLILVHRPDGARWYVLSQKEIC